MEDLDPPASLIRIFKSLLCLPIATYDAGLLIKRIELLGAPVGDCVSFALDPQHRKSLSIAAMNLRTFVLKPGRSNLGYDHS